MFVSVINTLYLGKAIFTGVLYFNNRRNLKGYTRIVPKISKQMFIVFFEFLV